MNRNDRTLAGWPEARKDPQHVVLSGYVGWEQPDGSELRIYPEMDANQYYVLDLKSPIEMVVIPDEPHARVKLVVESGCEIELVTLERMSAGSLARRRRRGTSSPAAPRRSTAARDLLIAIARATRTAGVTAVDDDPFRTTAPGAAQAWNQLLAAVGTPQELAAADEVVARCLPGTQ